MYKRFIEFQEKHSNHNLLVKFTCISHKCGVSYKVPKAYSDDIAFYKCVICGGRSVKCIDDNVIQIYPKIRRF